MHIVPAPAESLMKSRVLSIPGLQGVMDKGSAAFQTFRERDDQRRNAPPFPRQLRVSASQAIFI